MLALDSPRWATLEHLVGPASDVPDMLRQLRGAPDNGAFAAALQRLMGAIYYSHDPCSAAYAAAPYLVHLCQGASLWRRCRLIEALALIEAARRDYEAGGGPTLVPDDQAGAYAGAVAALPALIADCSPAPWDIETALKMAGALVIAKGHFVMGMEILKLQWDRRVRVRDAWEGEPNEPGQSARRSLL